MATLLAAVVAKGFGGRFCGYIDRTLPADRCLKLSPFPECLIAIGAPVYGGRVPLDVVNYLQTLHGNGQAAVLVAVYGNRDYEDALLELRDIAKDRGFVPVAAAAFIGEHSFSTEESSIAAGRPDKADIESAEKFADSVPASAR